MYQQQAESVKDLAKPVVEVLKRISYEEGVCNICNGTGQDIDYKTQCKKCSGTGKVETEWKWEPKVGEWCLIGSCVRLIDDNFIVADMPWGYPRIHKDYPIPIFHWEILERVLREAGYKTELDESSTLYKEFVIWDERQSRTVDVDGLINGREGVKRYKSWKGRAKSRQEAAMRAIIKLRKET